jgi:hypothetical protein
VLGAIFCLALPADVVEKLFFGGFHIFYATEAAYFSAISATGVATIWLGFRILRGKPAPRLRNLSDEKDPLPNACDTI